VHILLHKPKGKSRFRFHYWKHHAISRKNGNHDEDYSEKIFHNETWLTLLGAAAHLPLLWVWFPFAATAIIYALVCGLPFDGPSSRYKGKIFKLNIVTTLWKLNKVI
jgi:hypothetical protein